uniref:ATP-dependent DNA helicase n=1 Tax=Octopus bimaculoides TaxID=37653 RepID=A0A0L8FX41_OCTBM
MVHGPCGLGFNINSPYLKDSVCSKKFPKKFLQQTQTGADGYPSYRRRKPQDGSVTATIGQHEVDNRWIIPYCPLMSKIFNAHINIEFCNSVKSIKYVCKCVNKGSDAAVFALQQQYCQDEVTHYQVGRYISSNEAFWRIFGFPLHQRHLAIQQLAVHLINGQRVYFTDANASLLAEQPRNSTLTAFFKLCQVDPFAQTLLYPQIPSYYTWNGKQWTPRKAVLLQTCELCDPATLWLKYRDNLAEDFQRQAQWLYPDMEGISNEVYNKTLIDIEDRIVTLGEVRQHQDIAVAVASSEIAATLLPGGRTAHSTFKLPLNLAASDMLSCNITKSSDQGQRALEALDRGVTLLLSGDFRQTLPVILKGTRADEVQACLKSSTLWHHVTILSLNMRAQLHGDQMSKKFAQDILTIGDGKVPLDDAGEMEVWPFCSVVNSVDDLKHKVFPNFKENYLNHNWLYERAILAPKNVAVTKINQQLMHSLLGNLQTYKSVDRVPDTNEVVNYPPEFLNSSEPPGLPPHILSLKVGTPVMLLRNLEPPRLCNGTWLVIKKMMSHVIEATILSGCGKAGLLLEEPCFSYGQLYVGCSRVGSKTNLFAYAPQGKTRNIVYSEVL